MAAYILMLNLFNKPSNPKFDEFSPRTHRPIFHTSFHGNENLKKLTRYHGKSIKRYKKTLTREIKKLSAFYSAEDVKEMMSRDSIHMGVFDLYERIRQKEFPNRPSKFYSSFFSPSIEAYSKKSDAANTFPKYSHFIKKGNYFIANDAYHHEVGQALSEGNLLLAEDIVRKYWKGATSFGELRSWIKQGTAEILIPTNKGIPISKVKIRKNLLSGSHQPIIEGLKHSGWAARLRKLYTSFGSGWQGIQYSEIVSKAMMKAGEGHDNSSMLNRSIRSRPGSRRTSSAL